MAALAFAALALMTADARADTPSPRRLAVVVSYGAYASMPPLPICPRSAQTVSEALRRLGFEVTEIANASNGASSAQLTDFVRRLADPPAFLAVYACGYVTGFEGRPFMLPVSAALTRPSDVLTQGMLAKSFLDLARGGTFAALVVLDAVPVPGGSGAIGLGGLVHGTQLRPNLFVATAETSDATAPVTALSTALSEALGAPDADAAGVIDALAGKLTASASLATAGSAPDKALLSPPPPAPATPAPVAPAPVLSAPAVVAPAPPVVAAAPPEAASPALGEGDRRRVQAALKQLGLYSGAVDGVFGAETASAVRKFQIVRGVEPTGRLDAAQTLQLLGLVAKAP